MNRKKPIKVAVLGVGRIGRVQIRILESLGALVAGVLASTSESGRRAAIELAAIYGHPIEAYDSIDQLLESDIDAVTICSPPEFHFDQILRSFDYGLPVFCEKPMFWDHQCKLPTVLNRLSEIENHEQRRLFVNTSNAVFIDAVDSLLPVSDSIGRFKFKFYTNGSATGAKIALDLLPHGLSLVIGVFGERVLTDFRWVISDRKCECYFKYGNCVVEFDFREDPEGPRELSFGVNEIQFERIQKGIGATYQVFLQDVRSGHQIQVPDPFVTYLSKFLEFCEKLPSKDADDFASASLNMKLMAQCVAQKHAGTCEYL